MTRDEFRKRRNIHPPPGTLAPSNADSAVM
jgi:hypothetical protein